MKTIKLFYWSSKLFEHKPHENYGDLLSPYIVEQVSNSKARFFKPGKGFKSLFKKSYLMAIGSIMSHAQKKAVVWGSGILSRNDTFEKATFYAVRGPLSRKRVLEQGYSCPEIYGDPALLLPLYYKPEQSKKYKLGIIPHYVDYTMVQDDLGQQEGVSIIDLISDDIFATTDQICACEKIISSSLHGVIVAHAYGIPALWVPFSKKLSGDNVKFEDYFRSVQIEPYHLDVPSRPLQLEEIMALWDKLPTLPAPQVIPALQDALIKAFPAMYKGPEN
ncbi:MAG: polysaccharide pyruvyl transferase family protein [Nonlabens sp.]|nr:polysaccharide pyruvyl transferase family protein [Nonlabens sp.]